MRALSRRPARRIVLGGAGGLSGLLVLSACGPVDVTPQRLEASITTVFPNYYVQQQAMLGHPPVTAAALGAKASCDKGGPSIPDKGAGNDWICLVDWTDPIGGIHYTDADAKTGASKFELKVSSNGCYIAGGSTKTFGPVQIQGPDGKFFANPVSEFDGCFNVYDNRTALSRGTIPTAPSPRPTDAPCLESNPATSPATESASPTETPSATESASPTPAVREATATPTIGSGSTTPSCPQADSVPSPGASPTS